MREDYIVYKDAVVCRYCGKRLAHKNAADIPICECRLVYDDN